MNPYALHPGCDRITSDYREGNWLISISAQKMKPRQPVRVAIGTPIYAPPEDNDQTRGSIAKYALKAPLILTFGKI
ncbi:MAG TPA: hypothetical protein VGZ00_13185 [Candidatus Baltobacteraceae bacterium]|nr:hypothetical protein [Candidatus Baltobacteraceae bacterium]